MRPIDADALMKDVLFRCNNEIVKYKTMRHALGNVGRAAFDAVKAAPTIDTEPVRHGRWIDNGPDWACSYCGTEFKDDIQFINGSCDYYMPNYCPNCGAKMDLEVRDGT